MEKKKDIHGGLGWRLSDMFKTKKNALCDHTYMNP